MRAAKGHGGLLRVRYQDIAGVCVGLAIVGIGL